VEGISVAYGNVYLRDNSRFRKIKAVSDDATGLKDYPMNEMIVSKKYFLYPNFHLLKG
jgi:hypothetical protein